MNVVVTIGAEAVADKVELPESTVPDSDVVAAVEVLERHASQCEERIEQQPAQPITNG